MRPPTRSTRSVRPSLNTNNARRCRSTPGPSSHGSHPVALPEAAGINIPSPLKPKPQTSIIRIDDAKVEPGSSPAIGSDPAPAANAPLVGCFPVLPPSSTFVYESQNPPESPLPLVSLSPSVSVSIADPSIILGRQPSRPRHRMSTDKLETLDAFFRRNTHPSRKEKEAICKDLDMDLKTVTIWFQNKRQTLARSKRQLSSEGATIPTAAIDILAFASATKSPLVATEKTLDSVPIQPGSVAQGSYPDCPSLDQFTSRPQHASSCNSVPKTHSQAQALTQPHVPLYAVTHDPHVFVFEPVRTEMTLSCCASSPYPDLRNPCLGGGSSIHPEDLWRHIPSSPAQLALSSPDVSPDIGTPSRSSRFSVQRPRTLEWACARSAKRRRTDHGAVYQVDVETDGDYSPIDDIGTCRPSFSISETRIPPECYDKYPLDVVHGAILLLGLRDAAVDLDL